MANLGLRNLLPRLRETPSGIYLDGGDLGEILLPGRQLTADDRRSREIDVFIYRDSEDRLIATTQRPYAMLGEFAFLTVKHVHPVNGAYLDWGLAKDLLLPFSNATRPLSAGDRVVVAVCIDPETDRMVASMRIVDHLSAEPPRWNPGDRVSMLVWMQSPLGYTAIIENSHAGLLYTSEMSSPLTVGQRIEGFIRRVRDDGKIDLGVDQAGYARVAPLAQAILDALTAGGGRLNYDDDSTPDEIRQRFNVSKKAFKQALGALLRERRIVLLRPGIELVTPGDPV